MSSHLLARTLLRGWWGWVQFELFLRDKLSPELNWMTVSEDCSIYLWQIMDVFANWVVGLIHLTMFSSHLGDHIHNFFDCLKWYCRLSTGALSRLILSDNSLRMAVNEFRTSKVDYRLLQYFNQIFYFWWFQINGIDLSYLLHLSCFAAIWMGQKHHFSRLLDVMSHWFNWMEGSDK